MSFAVEALVVVAEPFMSALHLHRCDDELLDRLNHKASPGAMFLMVFIHTFYQLFLEKVIHCWTPSEYPDSWIEYTNAYCWIKNTYYLDRTQLHIPAINDSSRKPVIYYQWVPYMLAFLGTLAYVPSLCWYVGVRTSGLHIHEIVCTVKELPAAVSPVVRDRHMKSIAIHIDRALRLVRSFSTNKLGFTLPSRLPLVIVWIISKILHLLSSGLQIYAAYKFLGQGYLFYGFRVMKDMVIGKPGSTEAMLFPTITLCDFQVRDIGKHKPITVQCHLPINTFNAKIFLLVWFWLTSMAIINIFGLIQGLLQMLPCRRKRYIMSLLKSAGAITDDDDDDDDNNTADSLSSFVFEYLRIEGYLTLERITKNANLVYGAEITKKLWLLYNFKQQQRKKMIDDEKGVENKMQ